jgi:hypothetical protein
MRGSFDPGIRGLIPAFAPMANPDRTKLTLSTARQMPHMREVAAPQAFSVILENDKISIDHPSALGL